MAEPGVHRHAVRVYYEDTDAGGIVYHADFLKFAERARTEMLRAAGYDHTGLMAELGAGFAVRRCTIDYRVPALLDDLLEVESRLVEATGARLRLGQTIRRGDTVLVDIDIELALIDRRGRPKRMPPALVPAMRAAAVPDGAGVPAGP